MTAPPPTAAQEEVRPPRPVLVELAAAILIVGGVLNLLLSIDALLRIAAAGQPVGALAVITIALASLVLVLGVLVRAGRAWLAAVNVVTVLAFLELLSGAPIGLLFGALDVLVVLALFRERRWFRGVDEAEAAEADGDDGEPVSP